jgi:hypothetical protein
MSASDLRTRRPIYVLEIDHGRFVAHYTDTVWNGGWWGL